MRSLCGRPMYALKPGGSGDISVAKSAASSPHLAWRTEPGGPYSSTPVAYHGILFGVRDEGVLVAYDMSSGQRIFRDRTNLTHSASLIASDGHIYAPAETGEVLVVKADRAYSVVARNDMGESVLATPAIANGVLYIRTSGHLYALASERRRDGPIGSVAAAGDQSRPRTLICPRISPPRFRLEWTLA